MLYQLSYPCWLICTQTSSNKVRLLSCYFLIILKCLFLQIFNQSSGGSQVKNIINVFKGDANVKVNVIDTSSLYRNGDVVSNFDKRVKVSNIIKHFSCHCGLVTLTREEHLTIIRLA
jgi:hypothetical protein